MIEIHDVSLRFGKNTVLSHISYILKEGHIYGLVGYNGSGKTTLMRCICGFVHPDHGYIRVSGKQIGKDCDFAPSTGIIIENPGFIAEYSAMKNLCLLAGISGKPDKAAIAKCIASVRLDPASPKPVGKYSLGMRQRLGIAQAIMEDPMHLILDEPFNGLDKEGVHEMHALLNELRQKGKVILLASHNAQDIAMACDTVLTMADGKLTAEETYTREEAGTI
ncbi:MAG: ATP-binding cassette domain-containing protein [Clostridia bacterium]|nr:ATP-binding cassette domain-containing protein [Clostridia bacterium]MBR1686316.1 ATP-binding cassette domain-containing protein [Clostridia bacterium]MBR2288024.1 ATP-binding cassette domain-containing protein [Clostridia bacterium]